MKTGRRIDTSRKDSHLKLISKRLSSRVFLRPFVYRINSAMFTPVSVRSKKQSTKNLTSSMVQQRPIKEIFSMDRLQNLAPSQIEKLFMGSDKVTNNATYGAVNVHLHFALTSVDTFVKLLLDHKLEFKNYTETYEDTEDCDCVRRDIWTKKRKNEGIIRELAVDRFILTPKKDNAPYTITIDIVTYPDNSMYTVCAMKSECSIDHINKVTQENVATEAAKYEFVYPVLSKAGYMLHAKKGNFPDSLCSDLINEGIIMKYYNESSKSFPSDYALQLGKILVDQSNRCDIETILKIQVEDNGHSVDEGGSSEYDREQETEDDF